MKQVLKTMALAVTAAVSLSSAALAASDRPADLRVPYGDLDLRHPADAAAFDRRLSVAVEGWCAANKSRFEGRHAALAETSCRKDVAEQVRLTMPAAQRRALQLASSTRLEPALTLASR